MKVTRKSTSSKVPAPGISAQPPADAEIASPAASSQADGASATSEIIEWHPVSAGRLPSHDDDVLVELETGDDDRVFEGYQEEGQWFVGDDPVKVEVIAWAHKPGGTRRYGRPSADAPTDWREYVGKVLGEARQLVEDAEKIGEAGEYCTRLLQIAQGYVDDIDPDADEGSDMMDDMLYLEALFRGAAALPDAPLGVKLICERAAGLMDKATDVIDRAGIAAYHAKVAAHAH